MNELAGHPAIYPTWRSVGVMGAGAGLAVAATASGHPAWWNASLLWIGAVVAAVLVDGALSLRDAGRRLAVTAPDRLEAGGEDGRVAVAVPPSATTRFDLALEADPLLDVHPARHFGVRAGSGAAFRIVPRRRGLPVLRSVHVRWRGPLGLVWAQRRQPIDKAVAVVPRISLVRDTALRMLSRSRETGSAAQVERAASMELHGLREFRRGDDSRAVSWRQSARHRKLLVRDTQAERNRTVILAFDTGRLMCEPLGDGVPRLDHAINAAMPMAYAGLKAGDRVGLFAFDAKPGVASGAVSGIAAFGPLQRHAAAIDYSHEETNFTLGLSRLAATLTVRSLVVIFSEFADSTGAALMIESIGRLMARHLVLFVAFQDGELRAMIDALPGEAADVSRAVVASRLERERAVVLEQLRRLGVEVLDVPAAALGPALLTRYLALKREDRL